MKIGFLTVGQKKNDSSNQEVILSLFLSASAYVLMERLRRIGLAGTEMAKAQVSTIRLKLLKVASKAVVTVRRVVFQMSSSYPYRELFETVLKNLEGVRPVTPQPPS